MIAVDVLMMLLMGVMTIAIGIIFARNLKVVPPNRALVISGLKLGRTGYGIITSGRIIVWPIIQQCKWLNLEPSDLHLNVKELETKENIRIDLEVDAQFKIGDDVYALEAAANMLLDKERNEIDDIATRILEGHLRGICANLTLKQLENDRDSFSKAVLETVAGDMLNAGLALTKCDIRKVRSRGKVCPVCGEAA